MREIGFASYQNPSKRMTKGQRRPKDQSYKTQEDKEDGRHDHLGVAAARGRVENRWPGGSRASSRRELPPVSPGGEPPGRKPRHSAEARKGPEPDAAFGCWSVGWN